MNVSVENIRNSYKLIESINLDHDIVPFIQKHLFVWNKVTVLYLMAVVFLFLGMVVSPVLNWSQIGGIWMYLTRLFLGLFLFPLLIIPIHEGVHGLVYKLLGARQVRYTADFKRFVFTAQANKFVVSKNEFYWLAFAPFLVITIVGLAIIWYFPYWSDLILAFLFAHATMCAGDFGLASYFFIHRKKHPVTYDNFDDNRAYFFGQYENGSNQY